MKKAVPTGIGVLIALVLVAFGLIYGTYSGFQEDRAQVTSLLTAENGLMDVLGYRAADGFNLCAVARRHLDAKDEALLALAQSAAALRDASAAQPDACFAADQALTQAVEAVRAKLTALPSFQTSQRDAQYLSMLTADLVNLSGSAAIATYNEAAAAFNAQLDAPVSGSLARLLGVEACMLYQ